MKFGSPQYISGRDEFIINIIPVRSDSIEWLEGLGSNDLSYYIRESLMYYLAEKGLKKISSLTGAVVEDDEERKLKKKEMKIINSDDGQDDHSDLETNLNGWIDSV